MAELLSDADLFGEKEPTPLLSDKDLFGEEEKRPAKQTLLSDKDLFDEEPKAEKTVMFGREPMIIPAPKKIPLPEIEEYFDISKMEIADVKEYIKAAEEEGVPAGIRIVKTTTGKEIAISSPSMGRGRKLSKDEMRLVRDKEILAYDKVLQARTSRTEQMVQGLHRPLAELISGAEEIRTGKRPKLLMPGGGENITYDSLAVDQKLFFLAGNVGGYFAPGAIIRRGAEAGVMIGMTAAARIGLIKAATKAAPKAVATVTANKLKKDPALAAEFIRQYAGAVRKSWKVLALEGAAWEGVRSGGDAEAAALGAVLFPVTMPALEVGVGMAARGVSKLAGKAASKFEQTFGVAEKMKQKYEGRTRRPRVSEDLEIPPGAKEVSPKRPKAKQEPKTQAEKNADVIRETQVSTGEPGEVVLGEINITDPTYIARQATKLAKLEAVTNSKRAVRSSKLNVKIKVLKKNITPLLKSQEILVQKRNDIISKRMIKMGGEPTEAIPTSFDDLMGSDGRRLNYRAVTKLKNNYGSLVGMFKDISGGDKEIYDVVLNAGLSPRQAQAVSTQLKFPVTEATGLTDTGKAIVIKLTEAQKVLDRAIKANDKALLKYRKELGEHAKDPFYDPEVPTKYAKAKSQYIDEHVTKQMYYDNLVKAGLDPQEVEMSGARKMIFKHGNQTNKWNAFTDATGIDTGPFAINLGFAHNVRASLRSAAQKDLKLNKIRKELKTIEDLFDKERAIQIAKGEVPDISNETLWEWLHHITIDRNGSNLEFDPGEWVGDDGFTVPAIGPNDPSPDGKTIELLKDVRRLTHWGWKLSKGTKSGDKMGFQKRYVGLVKKREEYAGPSPKRKKKQEARRDIGFKKKRKTGYLEPASREEYTTRLSELIPTIVERHITDGVYDDLIVQAQGIMWEMEAQGYSSEAQTFLGYFQREISGGRRQDFLRAMQRKRVQKDMPIAEHMLNVVSEMGPKPLDKEFADAAQRIMYGNFIGLSVFANPRQFFQPETMFVADVGLFNVVKAKAIAYRLVLNKTLPEKFLPAGASKALIEKTMKRETVRAYDRVKSRVLEADIDYSDSSRATRPWVDKLVYGATLPGKPLSYLFKLQDQHINRVTGFFAHRMHLQAAYDKGGVAGLEKAMDYMTESERQVVLDMIKNKGALEGIDVGAIIGSNRGNWVYNLTEKPEFLAEGIGRTMPFQTWPLGNWNRYFEHIEQINKAAGKGKDRLDKAMKGFKGSKLLMRRFISGFLMVAAVQEATGVQFPAVRIKSRWGTLEVSSLVGTMSMLGVFDMVPLLGITSTITDPLGPQKRMAKKIERKVPGLIPKPYLDFLDVSPTKAKKRKGYYTPKKKKEKEGVFTIRFTPKKDKKKKRRQFR